MLTEFLLNLVKSRDLECAWALLTEKMTQYGFDRVIFGYTRFRTEKSFGDFEDNLVLSNHDAEYLDKFLGEKLYYHSPMMRWANENSGAMSWSWVRGRAEQGILSKKELEIIELNVKFDISAGYTISFHSTSHRTRSILSLTGRSGITQDQVDDIWAEHGDEIELIWQVANLKLTSLPYATDTRKLTKRQVEVLEWVSDGKTTADAAKIMGLTPATVEKHLRLARDILNVDTTAQAILKASLLNQIFTLDS